MTPEQIGGAIGLVVTTSTLALIPLAIIADARAEKAHRAWQRRWSAWLDGGMQGPRP